MIATDAPRSTRAELLSEAARRRVNVLQLDAARRMRSIDGAAGACAACAIAVCGPAWMQARVAAVASGRDLPFACVPCGEDDLLARDLGLSGGEPGEWLGALLDGDEQTLDLGEVNGIAFVNYVAVGDCAGGTRPRLDPLGRDGLAGLLVTNNAFAFDGEELLPRERIDGGLLGVATREARAGRSKRRSPPGGPRLEPSTRLELSAEGPLLAEVDGWPCVLSAPLRFRALAGAVRALLPHRS
jgi:diacylglycerol kinase family enzyme